MEGKQILRIATYNILNTKDRYDEREPLLKKAVFSLEADLIGLQEVVFGPKQLDELTALNSGRHQMASDQRVNCYHKLEAPLQVEPFWLMKHPDPDARIDGNAILMNPEKL